MIPIDLNETVADILKTHPSFKLVLLEAGFNKLTNPVMLETVGKVTKLKHGMAMRKVPLETLQTIASKHGFILVSI